MDNPYYEKLVNAALRFISYRPRSEKELRDFLVKKLTRWKVSGGILVSKVVARMGELGYVDDEAFASWWVVQRTDFNAKGDRLIEMELHTKGLAKEAVRKALAGRDSLAAARRALGKKSFKEPGKLYAFLARRGFDADTIKKVQYGKISGD